MLPYFVASIVASELFCTKTEPSKVIEPKCLASILPSFVTLPTSKVIVPRSFASILAPNSLVTVSLSSAIEPRSPASMRAPPWLSSAPFERLRVAAGPEGLDAGAGQIGHAADDRDGAAVAALVQRDRAVIDRFDHTGVGAVAVEADSDGCKSLGLDRPQVRQRDIRELDLRALAERLDQELIGETVAVPV